MPKNPSYIQVPTVSEFMSKKIDIKLTEPPWVYLEREMKENAESGRKPYNKKVANWLKFLKELKEYFAYERKETLRKMNEDTGPPWFIQLSPSGLEETAKMEKYVHNDVMSHTYDFSLAALRKIGITTKFTESMLETAIRGSGEDAGVFLWTLYTLYYKTPPSEPLPKYSMNAKLLLSAIMCVDLPGCIKKLDQLTNNFIPLPKPTPKKTKSYYKPNIKLGEYLAEDYAKCYKPKNSISTKQKQPEVDYRLKLWERPTFEKMAQKNMEVALEKRRQKHEDEKIAAPVCTYKFWHPPIGTLISNAVEREYLKLSTKVFKNKPKPPPKLPFEHIPCHLGTVTYSGNRPHYQIHDFATLPFSCILHNGGRIKWNLDNVIHILGYVKDPEDIHRECQDSCKCMEIWPVVQKHLANSKCKCGHRYDFNNKAIIGKSLNKYFKPPTKYHPYTVDEYAIADIGSQQDFIHTTVEEAVKSESSVPASIIVQNLRSVAPKIILMSLLADLMDSALLIPHMPKAYLLPNIQAWVRNRVKGPIGPKLNRKLEAKTRRAWMYLKHLDFRPRPHRIPYLQDEVPKYNFSHRYLIQEIEMNQFMKIFNFSNRANFEIAKNISLFHAKVNRPTTSTTREKEFEKLAEKTKRNMMLESRLLWATMRYYDYPMKQFLRTFCAYMPVPEKKVLIYAPPKLASTKMGKTCPLAKPPSL